MVGGVGEVEVVVVLWVRFSGVGDVEVRVVVWVRFCGVGEVVVVVGDGKFKQPPANSRRIETNQLEFGESNKTRKYIKIKEDRRHCTSLSDHWFRHWMVGA